MTFAFLKSLGYIPRSSDLLNSWDSGFAIKSAVSFRNFTGRPSGPVDLLGSNEFKIASTSCSLVVICSSGGICGLFVEFNGGACVFGISSVDCEAKWSTSNVALSWSSVSISPSGFNNGGIVSLCSRPVIARSVLWYLCRFVFCPSSCSTCLCMWSCLSFLFIDVTKFR